MEGVEGHGENFSMDAGHVAISPMIFFLKVLTVWAGGCCMAERCKEFPTKDFAIDTKVWLSYWHGRVS